MTITLLLNLVAVLLAAGLLAATVRLSRRPSAAALPAHEWVRQQTAPEPEPAERW
jgi:hypothetical protein